MNLSTNVQVYNNQIILIFHSKEKQRKKAQAVRKNNKKYTLLINFTPQAILLQTWYNEKQVFKQLQLRIMQKKTFFFFSLKKKLE